MITPEDKLESICLTILGIIEDNREMRKVMIEQEEELNMYRKSIRESNANYNKMFGDLLTSYVRKVGK